jgi:hypothetical protein
VRTGRWRDRPARHTVLPALLIVGLAGLTIAGLAVRPPPEPPPGTTSRVIIAGAPGLRWDDVDRARTPHLWQLAGTGAIGSLSVRSGSRPTCPADGWLTLGAGNWAADTTRPSGTPCSRLEVAVESTDAVGAYLPGHETVVRDNRWQLPWGAVPGALAGAVGCTTAIGDGGALAAARVYGRVDRYVTRLPSEPSARADLLRRCELTLLDLGPVTGDGATRAATLARVDRALGALLAGRPADSLLLVAGVADTHTHPRLHLVLGHGPGLDGGLLTSDTTRRTGYLQLVDLAPTALAALGLPPPDVRLAGHPARQVPVAAGELEPALQRLISADEAAGRSRVTRGWFVAGLAAAQLLLLAAAVPILRRPVASPARTDHRLLRWWRAAVPPGLLAVSLLIPAGLVAGGLPWWRGGAATVAFAVTCLLLVAAVTVVVVRSPGFGRMLTLIAVCAAVAAGVLAGDLLTGSRLQLNGVLGYSAHDGDRLAGLGPVGAGVLMAGTLLVAGCVAQRLARRWRPVVVVAIGAVGVLLVGNAYLGADTGGAVALTAGVCLAAAMCAGGWLTFGRLAWATVAGVAVVAAVAVAELRQPTERRGGLGRLLAELADGTAGFGLRRVALANWESLSGDPMPLLAVGSGLFVWLALLRPWGGLKRVFGIYPALRAGMVGTVLAGVLGGVLTGAALTVAAAAAAVAVPLATVAALRIRQQARSAAGAPAAVAGRQVLW